MKSRAISLGASVIALSLTAAAPAGAADLGGLNHDVKAQTETTIGGPAGSVTVEGVAKVPVKVPSKRAADRIAKGEAEAKDITKGADRPKATVEANRRSGDDHTQAVVDWNGGTGVSAYADHRRKGVLEVESLVRTHGNRAHGTAAGYARGAGSTRLEGKGRVAKSGRQTARVNQSVRPHARPEGLKDRLPSTGGHHKLPKPLRAIGREVGNPIELSLAGWLVMLTGVGFLAVTRLVRRLQRLS